MSIGEWNDWKMGRYEYETMGWSWGLKNGTCKNGRMKECKSKRNEDKKMGAWDWMGGWKEWKMGMDGCVKYNN